MSGAKDLTDRFFPGLGDQHVIGATNLGVTIIDTTLGCNSNMTNAQLLASPPNTDGVSNAFGPVVHSLGVAPAFAFAQPRSQSLGMAVSYVFITADNSAVYFKPFTFTVGPVGVATRIVAVR